MQIGRWGLGGALAIIAGLSPTPGAGQAGCTRGDRPLYAHNDYTNPRPLLDALDARMRGVEADVVLVDGVLRVGHDRRAARRSGRLDSLYLLPLADRVRGCGSLTADGRPFLLTIDQKERSRATYDAIVDLLGRSGLDASVRVVLVGWVPEAAPSSDTVKPPARQVAIRHHRTPSALRLRDVDQLLSLDYGKTIGRARVFGGGTRWWQALRAWRASAPDRVLRVHNVPPDARVYAALLAAGVDLIGTRTLAASAVLVDSLAHAAPR